jgi:hypothetical protein
MSKKIKKRKKEKKKEQKIQSFKTKRKLQTDYEEINGWIGTMIPL